VCEGNAGNGLHPGSGSVGVAIRGCVCAGNGASGVFFCLRATRTLIEDCVFNGNGRHGIEIGHRDTDIEIRRCVVKDNARHGVYFREDPLELSGNRTLLTENVIKDNRGACEIYLDSKVRDVYIHNNIGIGPGQVRAASDDYLTGVSFDAPPAGMNFHACDGEQELYHLGPWRPR